jgi:hypothetical protein
MASLTAWAAGGCSRDGAGEEGELRTRERLLELACDDGVAEGQRQLLAR